MDHDATAPMKAETFASQAAKSWQRREECDDGQIPAQERRYRYARVTPAHRQDGDFSVALASKTLRAAILAPLARLARLPHASSAMRHHMPRSVETRPRATILVVDDDHDMMRIMLHMLAGAGYYPIPAHGGRAALRQAQQRPPDLVLTDLQMPDISGVEVITRLKGDPRTACIPVLAVTGCEWDELSRSAAHAGCDGYISKPVRRGMLLLAIEQAIAHSRSPGTCDPDPPAAA